MTTAATQEPERTDLLKKVVTDVKTLTPTFTPITPTSINLCDRHPTAQAVVEVKLPTGGILHFCGACARKHFGYEHTKTAKPENRLQGSSN